MHAIRQQSSIPHPGSVPRIATYRLQLTPSFGFSAARAVLPYLRDLGISHVYASPIAQPNPGSQHGYDICDPREPNQELGTFDQLIDLLNDVRRLGMGWVQDIVPNHLAMSVHNPFLRDVLMFGQRSRWEFLFDIDWSLPEFRGRMLLPWLSDSYARLLQAEAFRLTWDETGPLLIYGDYRLPLSPGSVAPLLDHAGAPPEIVAVLGAAETEDDHDQRSIYMAAALQRSPEEIAYLAEMLERITDVGAIDRVLQRQSWQLAWWRTGREVIGYRRFFAVDSLIAVRPEDPRAFALLHALTFELHDRGLLAGVRVDHIDGLRDPRTYLERLRARLPESWILVEKILGTNESLPSWPVDGTTGYEIINALTATCCNPRSENLFTTLHRRVTGATVNAISLAESLREDVDHLGLGGDLERTVTAVLATAADSPLMRDVGRHTLRRTLSAFVACLPVYRTYIGFDGGSEHDRTVLMQARAQARRDHPDLAVVIDALAALMDLSLSPGAPASVLAAVQRIQQFSGPVMAKGWEDTFLYRWSRLLAFNEVGGDPRKFGMTSVEFLAFIARRDLRGGLNATSTHDTKRGEDVRMRLAALTWHFDQWDKLIHRWEFDDQVLIYNDATVVLPSSEDRYHLYQTLYGTWPVDGRIDDIYCDRLRAYALKAVRESGSRTSWIAPDHAYETGLLAWINALLLDETGAGFRSQLSELVERLTPHATSLALVQTVLKCTIPGVPDVYQGAEWHDLSLVDPDNRRLVDFTARAAAYSPTAAFPQYAFTDPRAKQALLAACLRMRRDSLELWESGRVVQVRVDGESEGVLAFSRVTNETAAIVVVRLRPEMTDPLLGVVPDATWSRRAWREVFSGRYLSARPSLIVGQLLQRFPCVVLVPA